MERWDLIIVGGGPAGLSTALHLCRLDPAWAARILIEKARYPRHKLCGGGITEYGLRCLSGLGLDIAEVPRVPIDELRMVRGRHRASFHSGHGLTIFRRDAFDAWLAQKVLAAGVRLSQGETVSRLETTKGGVQVTTDRAATWRAPWSPPMGQMGSAGGSSGAADGASAGPSSCSPPCEARWMRPSSASAWRSSTSRRPPPISKATTGTFRAGSTVDPTSTAACTTRARLPSDPGRSQGDGGPAASPSGRLTSPAAS